MDDRQMERGALLDRVTQGCANLGGDRGHRRTDAAANDLKVWHGGFQATSREMRRDGDHH